MPGRPAHPSGLITGRLLLVGGPHGKPNRPVAGTVSVSLAETADAPLVLAVATESGYSTMVNPGEYWIEGESPMATTGVDGGPRIPIRGIGTTPNGVQVTESTPVAVEAAKR